MQGHFLVGHVLAACGSASGGRPPLPQAQHIGGHPPRAYTVLGVTPQDTRGSIFDPMTAEDALPLCGLTVSVGSGTPAWFSGRTCSTDKI